jgi:hypothetical protein
MDASTPLFEEILIYTGHLICLFSALYLVKVGQLKIGITFLVAFILLFQANYVMTYIDSDSKAQGICWATVSSYYECLPIAHRISIHAAQFGVILIGFAIILSTLKLRKFNEEIS